jgi:hypothetical protein
MPSHGFEKDLFERKMDEIYIIEKCFLFLRKDILKQKNQNTQISYFWSLK